LVRKSQFDRGEQIAQSAPPKVEKAIMDYPREFSQEARNRVEAAMILARREMAEARRTSPAPWSHNVCYPGPEFQEAFFASIMRVFLVFARDAVHLCTSNGWALDRVNREANEFLRVLTVKWRFEEGRDARGNEMRDVCGNWGGGLERWVDETFRNREEWRRYEDLLLEISGVVNTLTAPSGPETASANSPEGDPHLITLEAILEKFPTTLEKWADRHKFGRTTVFDWRSARSAGRSPAGKVSVEKSTEIEKAIEDDANVLGLELGLHSDSNSD